ncbi:MAG: bifunctional phosphopantothenoylcysteine decarboxylase/phosphopantothenate--cysteine ligase CoaBC [Actinomycetota bacterium]
MSGPRESESSSALAGRRVLLAVSGGIAAYKSCELVRSMVKSGARVQVVMTKAATRFVGPDTFAALSGNPVQTDLFENPEEVLHVRLAGEADVAIVAPATANVLAKMALGFADDLVTSTLLEVKAPVVVAPAMHTGMYQNAATQENLRILSDRGIRIVGPEAGPLAAGDEGIGRMADVSDILAATNDALSLGRELSGSHILVSAGATWEPLDPVRFIGNRSSGKMGIAIASEAVSRGAVVTLVLGPSTEKPPPEMETISVTSSQEMSDAMIGRFDSSDAVVMAAAVADFRPDRPADSKLKKENGVPEIRLVPTPDILRELSARRRGQVLVGFAAETEELERAGREKLESKGLDAIVVNEVGREGTGFGSETNHALILTRAGEDAGLRMWSKQELAVAVCDRLAKLLAR